MTPPEIVRQLVQRFSDNQDAYESPGYKEAQLREEFINPFFEALGWDVQNRSGHAEAYKDVIHEDAIKIGGFTKAPDYSFRVGGRPAFFVEGKKPAVRLKTDEDPAFQLRRYAWSAKLPVSILTNFAEFAVYDTRIQPKKGDKASVARLRYYEFSEYEEKWDEIAGLISRDALLKGALDRFVQSKRAKRGSAEVDQAFLAQIEEWRSALARNLALRNVRLDVHALNFAVQRIIDRIVFLRICEDRGIEEYGQLQALENGANIYSRLKELFWRADERYNSGLFHFRAEKDRSEPPDELTGALKVDDGVLKEIVRGLYYPESPFEFSVLPADILGQVYEQFLGKVIRLTEGHHAKVEDKPEVKKAGGVYYTPTYIVEYIVQETVGKLLEGKTPREAARLTVLDPACGSGTFLITAYQHLLDWHRDWYVKDGPEKHGKQLFQGPGGAWRLATSERKRILLNSIYGVDIDPQAVEVTKLSLLLRVLEGESADAINQQLKLFHERALPDLGKNVQCGNSLIGSDYYTGAQLSLLDDGAKLRINAFDWRIAFPSITEHGGFDAVIGNPPYVRMEEFKPLKAYLKEHFASHDERSDLYAYFVERSHALLRLGGRFGMIISNKFLRANYGKPLRDHLMQVARLERIVDFAGLPVFPGATVRTIILITSRGRMAGGAPPRYSAPLKRALFDELVAGRVKVSEAVGQTAQDVPAAAFSAPVWSFGRPHANEVVARLSERFPPLKAYVGGRIFMGVKSGLTRAFVIDENVRRNILRRNSRASDILKPFITGKDVRRYHIDYQKQYLIYTYHGIDMTPYPAVVEHLRPFRAVLQKRATRQAWYELQQPQLNFAKFMQSPKIVFPDIATEPRFALDDVGYFGANTTYFIPRWDPVLCGVLNSRFARFYFEERCAVLEGPGESYLRFFGQYLEGFPVPFAGGVGAEGPRLASEMTSLVEHATRIAAQLAVSSTDHEQNNFRRQLQAVDAQIDTLVYHMYGLSDADVRIISEATAVRGE